MGGRWAWSVIPLSEKYREASPRMEKDGLSIKEEISVIKKLWVKQS